MQTFYKPSTRNVVPVLLILCTLLTIGLGYRGATADGGQPKLPVINISINDAVLEVEIAHEPRQRFHGLSMRETLPENAGMLFVYRAEDKLLFTMRGTSIPLSIAFVDKDLKINEILDMEPFEDGPFPSQHLSKFALETRQGWFSRNNIGVGDQLIPEKNLPIGR